MDNMLVSYIQLSGEYINISNDYDDGYILS